MASIKKYAAGYAGYASGGLVTRPGLYALAEKGPELVLPADWTEKILRLRQSNWRDTARPTEFRRRPSQQGIQAISVTVRQDNWRFEGSFTDGDKRWFREVAKDTAFIAVETAVKEASRGN